MCLDNQIIFMALFWLPVGGGLFWLALYFIIRKLSDIRKDSAGF